MTFTKIEKKLETLLENRGWSKDMREMSILTMRLDELREKAMDNVVMSIFPASPSIKYFKDAHTKTKKNS